MTDRTEVPARPQLYGEQAFCFLCGGHFPNMRRYIAHRYEADGITVRPGGCRFIPSHNSRDERQG
jgi:hypothetical protein